MSSCAYCGGYCGKGDPNSHGICQECLAKVSPNCPQAKRHKAAMSRGLNKLVDRGMINLALMVIIKTEESPNDRKH